VTSSHQNTPIAVVRDIENLRAAVRSWRRNGDRIALVPTMGALHAGHLALVAAARSRARRVVTSIFVNPTQFAPTEDFSKYPRTFEADRAKLETAGCDMIWAPTVSVMYPDGFATKVHVDGPARGLETDFRPHFFSGVATVCTKLFTQVGPDVAIFGEKDYQQLLVVRQVARDLDLGLEIVGHPTVREPDGLAMSSRNVYLSTADRQTAVALHATLQDMRSEVSVGVSCGEAERRATAALKTLGFRVDYVAARNAETLEPPNGRTGEPLRILAAARLGSTRLIDNIAV
jgi:pantoate--beta-alanine ligase